MDRHEGFSYAIVLIVDMDWLAGFDAYFKHGHFEPPDVVIRRVDLCLHHISYYIAYDLIASKCFYRRSIAALKQRDLQWQISSELGYAWWGAATQGWMMFAVIAGSQRAGSAGRTTAT